jgi:hypothetical protein
MPGTQTTETDSQILLDNIADNLDELRKKFRSEGKELDEFNELESAYEALIERLECGEDEDEPVDDHVYTRKSYLQFVRDMRRADLDDALRHYRGRCFYEGPAVVVKNVQDALSETKVPCVYDNMGMDYIVYPKY